MRLWLLITTTVFVGASTVTAAVPVFFVQAENFGYEARGGSAGLLFGHGEVIAGDVSMRFGDGRVHPEPLDPFPLRVNSSVGAAFARIRYRQVYPGIDLVYHGEANAVEFDFIVAPKADYRRIKLRFEGASVVKVATDGSLIVRSTAGELRHRPPFIYQERRGKREQVAGRFVLSNAATVTFAVGRYDRTRSLVIDPVVSYSSFLGGARSDHASAVATGVNGSTYIAMTTTCPTCDAANTDVLAVQLDATGRNLVYATYIGGSGPDFVMDLALDSAGNAYIAGVTKSGDFPYTPGAYRRATGATEAFVAKLNAAGVLSYSTTLGSGIAYAIAVNTSGNAYAAGSTAGEFPTTPGSWQTAPQGMNDAFVAQLNALGSALVYSTLVGGNGDDHARAIALDHWGQVTIVGHTSRVMSGDPFPVSPGAYASGGATGIDAFVTRLNAAGTALVYSANLGGLNDDFAYGLAIDSQTNAFVTGTTVSGDFPITAGAFRTTRSAGFVTKINAAGTALLYSSYLDTGTTAFPCLDVPAARACGGGFGIVADTAGRAHITGTTNAGAPDVFVTQVDAAGAAVLYHSLLGGLGADIGQDIALDAAGQVYIAGSTASADGPIRDAYDATYNGSTDSFVAVLDMSPGTCSYSLPQANRSFEATGGTGAISISTQPGCSWMSAVTSAYNDPFVAITGSSSGTGSGIVTYSVAPHNAALPRTATIAAGRQIFTIAQAAAPCSYGLSPASASTAAQGGSGSFAVTTPTGCSWTVSSSAGWVTASVSGSTVNYSVAANHSGAMRTATVSVAGQTFVITQAAGACRYLLPVTSASVPQAGATGTFAIEAPEGCAWTVAGTAAWLTIMSPSGSGAAIIRFSATANNSVPQQTTGHPGPWHSQSEVAPSQSRRPGMMLLLHSVHSTSLATTPPVSSARSVSVAGLSTTVRSQTSASGENR